MRIRGLRSGSIAAVLLLSAGAAAQPAPDCRQAKTEAEKAICGNAELAAADKSMAQAYAGLRAELPPEQQKTLLADQRRWITRRQALCGDKSQAALAQCLLARTEARRRFLAGESPNGAPGAPRIIPGLFHEMRKGHYEISIEYPQMLAPRGSAATALEQAARAIAFGKDAVSEYRNMEPPTISGSENFYDVGYEITYADPRLVSAVFSIATFTGGAHPNSARVGLLFDFEHGRALQLTDFLADSAKAAAAITEKCKAQIEAKAAKEDWQPFDNADFAAVVREADSWAADKDGIDIMFDPYSVAAYAVGPQDCRLSYAELAPWLKPGGPLPPH